MFHLFQLGETCVSPFSIPGSNTAFYDNTEILTSNQFDPLDNVNQIKTKNPHSSKNGRNNKGHKTTKRVLVQPTVKAFGLKQNKRN